MHLNEVRATAFGPFRGSSLQLAPGMNIIHGPNESGKSSWYAATYAGLAGRRRARGRGTIAQAEFAKRHKPWSGSLWSAGVTVTLDSGLVLGIEHDLGKGESRVLDSQTRRVIPLALLEQRLGIDLTTDSTLDGTRLVGLTRDSARATIFTGQADVLRVLEDAGELQEFIERAATSGGADATSEGALAWLRERHSELVGSEHVGRKPLRARAEELEQMRALSSTRRDQLIRLTEVITERQNMAAQLRLATEDMDRASRFEKWKDIRALQERLHRAESLVVGISSLAGTDSEIDEERLQEAAMILGAFDAGADVPPLPSGATAEDLAAEIAALPALPEGDQEPRKEVLDARQDLIQASAALNTHVDATPADEPASVATTFSADELRTLADSLEAPAPIAAPGLAEELGRIQELQRAASTSYEDAQAAYAASLRRNEERRRTHVERLEEYARLLAEVEASQAEHVAREAAARLAESAEAGAARKRGTLISFGGVLLMITGLALSLLGQPVLGVATGLVGVAVLVGLFLAGLQPSDARTVGKSPGEQDRPGGPPQPPMPEFEDVAAPVPPSTDPRVLELQDALKAHDTARRLHAERVNFAVGRLHELQLGPDPAALRQLARALDDAAAARVRQQRHQDHGRVLRSKRDEAAQRLARALGEQLSQVVAYDEIARLLLAVEDYVRECRVRAAAAHQAGRLVDLSAALEQRRQLEMDRAAATSERQRQKDAVVDYASGLGQEHGLIGSTAAQAAERLRDWLDGQQQQREAQAERSKLTARLDQLLEGRPSVEWHTDLARMIEAAGSEPPDMPADLEAFRTNAARRHEALVRQAGVLAGRQDQLSRSLGSVAEAVELEADAERALAEVHFARRCIDAATAQLTMARNRAHATIAPALESRLTPWVPRITDGRYLDVSVDPSNLNVKVTELSGAVRQARLLSHGTTEQIYLLLRIALAQVLSGARETTPIILDDVTVQSDQQRTTAILRMLHELSAEHQVVLFTQEQEVVDWAHANLTGDRDRIHALTPG